MASARLSRSSGLASHFRASTNGKVAGSAKSESPPRGVMRGTAASSNALSSPPTWPSSRRTTTARSAHATPSSTWRRRSSRATAAFSSDVCAPAHPAYDRAAPRCVVASITRPATGSLRRKVREDVRVRIPRHHQAVGGSPDHQRLLGERGLLVVVDQQVIEGRIPPGRLGAGGRQGCGGLIHQPCEVHLVVVVQDVQVAPVEPGQLAPSGETGFVGPCLDLVGAEQRFLGPQQELTNLVGESPEREHAPVRRPVRGVLSRQEFLHPRELVHGREQLRGPLVAEGPEELRDHVVGETVDRHHFHAGKGPGETVQQPPAGRASSRLRPDHQAHPLGVGAGFDQPGEPLPNDTGLAGAGRALDQERTPVMGEDPLLLDIGFECGGMHLLLHATPRH